MAILSKTAFSFLGPGGPDRKNRSPFYWKIGHNACGKNMARVMESETAIPAHVSYLLFIFDGLVNIV
jgi:hypothetical protein